MTTFTIVRGTGAGGFLAPPGDPAHTFSVIEKSSNRSNAREVGSYSVDSVANGDDEWIPEHIRNRAAKIVADASRTESPLWVANVYGYFRNMWTPEGKKWDNVSSLLSGRPEGYPDEWHAAPVYIRGYFPNHITRADLIKDPGKGYGAWPCGKCNERVQYEARFDALTKVTTRIGGSGVTQWSYGVDCPQGGRHEH